MRSSPLLTPTLLTELKSSKSQCIRKNEVWFPGVLCFYLYCNRHSDDVSVEIHRYSPSITHSQESPVIIYTQHHVDTEWNTVLCIVY